MSTSALLWLYVQQPEEPQREAPSLNTFNQRNKSLMHWIKRVRVNKKNNNKKNLWLANNRCLGLGPVCYDFISAHRQRRSTAGFPSNIHTEHVPTVLSQLQSTKLSPNTTPQYPPPTTTHTHCSLLPPPKKCIIWQMRFKVTFKYSPEQADQFRPLINAWDLISLPSGHNRMFMSEPPNYRTRNVTWQAASDPELTSGFLYCCKVFGYLKKQSKTIQPAVAHSPPLW